MSLAKRARMKSSGFAWALLLVAQTLACSDGDNPEGPTAPDAGSEGSVEAAPPEASPEASNEADTASPEGGDGADVAEACANPVMHGVACSVEGSTACGWQRDCTDVGTNRTTICTCTNGRYRCGDCPHCMVDLSQMFCGIGQVCDAVTLQLCGGGTVTAASCTCYQGTKWSCEEEDGGRREYLPCGPDGGSHD
jgi:hypothetical protein